MAERAPKIARVETKICKNGCGRVVRFAGFDTCCRECGQSNGAAHSESCGMTFDPLLDAKISDLEPRVQEVCDNEECRIPGLSDNARDHSKLEVVKTTGIVERDFVGTPRDILRHNRSDAAEVDLQLAIRCMRCSKLLETLRCHDTDSLLAMELRQYVTHDRNVPLLYTPAVPQRHLPWDALRACEYAHMFPTEQVLTPAVLKAIRSSLQRGPLKEMLAEKKRVGGLKSYIRIGVGLEALGPVTVILEFWPAGHSSPRHQHGGCAGSVRVIHGILDVQLFEQLQSKFPMRFSNGDAGLELPPGQHDTLQLKPGMTTWLNRGHWYVHEVACKPDRPENREYGFALSLHGYISCTDEFEFVPPSADGETKASVKRNPKNDYFWNIDLPADDPRVNEKVPDFEVAIGIKN